MLLLVVVVCLLLLLLLVLVVVVVVVVVAVVVVGGVCVCVKLPATDYRRENALLIAGECYARAFRE